MRLRALSFALLFFAPVSPATGGSSATVIISFSTAVPADIEAELLQENAVLMREEPRLAFVVAETADPATLIARMTERTDVAAAYVPQDATTAANEMFCGLNAPTLQTGCVVACSTSPTYLVSDPNDPYFHATCSVDQWQAQWGARMVNATEAWRVEDGNDAVMVAVVDGGVDGTHGDLQGSFAKVGDVYGINTFNATGPALDDTGHGTFVTGILAARSANGAGIAGMAQVQTLPVKVCRQDRCPVANVAIGIVEAVASGARVISISLAAAPPSAYTIAPEAEVIYRAIDYAHARGAMVVATAGNGHRSTLSYPASHPKAFSVTSVDPTGVRASYANFGPGLEMAAPGGESNVTGIASTLLGGGYGFGRGTSFAAPFVSGAAGLIFSKHPTWNGTNVAECLLLSATPARRSSDQLVPNDDYGYGILDAGRALASCELRSGKIVLVNADGEIIDQRIVKIRT